MIQPASIVKYSSRSKRLKRLGATSQRLPASVWLRAAAASMSGHPIEAALIYGRLLDDYGRYPEVRRVLAGVGPAPGLPLSDPGAPGPDEL